MSFITVEAYKNSKVETMKVGNKRIILGKDE